MQVLRRERPTGVLLEYPTIGFRRSVAVHLFGPVIRWRRSRPCLVVTLHEHAASPLLGKIRNLAVVCWADHITVSNTLDLAALPGWAQRRAEIVPIGSNIDVVPADDADVRKVAEPFGIDAASAYVVFFGHPFRTKRLEALIDAVPSLPLPLLVIAQFDRDDPYQRSLFERIDEVGRRHPGRIVLAEGMGDREVSWLLRVGRYLVMPEHHPLTGKSGSCLAGLVHGLIVVGRAGAEPEDNLPYVDGVNARLLAALDGESIARSIAELEAAPPVRARLVDGARATAVSLDWAAIARRMTELAQGSDPTDRRSGSSGSSAG